MKSISSIGLYSFICLAFLENFIFHMTLLYYIMPFLIKLKDSFIISCRTGFVVINSLSFCLSWNDLILFYFWRTISWLTGFFFSLSTLNISFCYLLAFKFYGKNLLIILVRYPCMWWVTFLFLLSKSCLCFCEVLYNLIIFID